MDCSGSESGLFFVPPVSRPRDVRWEMKVTGVPTIVEGVTDEGMDVGQYCCRHYPKLVSRWRKVDVWCPYCLTKRLVTDVANVDHSRVVKVLSEPLNGRQRVLTETMPSDLFLLACSRCKNWFASPKTSTRVQS